MPITIELLEKEEQGKGMKNCLCIVVWFFVLCFIIFFRINDAMNFINLWIEAFICKTVRQSPYILFIH